MDMSNTWPPPNNMGETTTALTRAALINATLLSALLWLGIIVAIMPILP